jgi:hypothetical protein
MIKRLKTVLLFLFVFPLMTACCNEETYEVTITGVETRALILDENGFFTEFDLQNPIDKEDLLIEVTFTEIEEIASIQGMDKKHTKDKVIEAAIVPCEDQVVVYKNSVESVRIEVVDLDNNNARIDITNQVVIEGSQISIADYINDFNPGLRVFAVELTDTSNLPDRIVYEIEAILDDGSRFTANSGTIPFNE